MKAVILSAGQGKRLLPLTESLPKSMLDVGENLSILSWQLSQLAEAGVEEAVVVTGFCQQKIVEELQSVHSGIKVSTYFNPFYKVTDNLGSVWLAREHLKGDCMLINGDTLFTASAASTVLSAPEQPVTVTVACKGNYDDDDMKVTREGNVLKAIGKTLDLSGVNAESIGMIKFNAEGAARFSETIDAAMRDETSLKRYYLHIIHVLAQSSEVNVAEIPSDQWCEVDTIEDLEAARGMVANWQGAVKLSAAG